MPHRSTNSMPTPSDALLNKQGKPRWVWNKDRNQPRKRIKIGYIIAEEFVEERDTPHSIQRADYKKVIQLIHATDERLRAERKEYLIRFGYYLKNSNENGYRRWGSQTTFQLPVDKFVELLSKARKNGSFNEILRGL